MKRYMKRIFCLLCAMALLAACIFSGCSSKTEATVKGDTIRHEFKTFVYSDFYREIYDGDTEETFRAYCEAVSRGETEFVCKSNDYRIVTRLKMLASEYMPIAYIYADITTVDADNVAHIDYGMPTDECETTDYTEIAVWEWLMENIGDELEGKGYVLVIDGTGHL